MALVPLTLRPSFILRRNALRKGLLGPSLLWKVVAAVVFGRSTVQKMFGRQSESLGRRTIGVGTVLTIAATAPLSRRQAKRSGITKDSVAAGARAELEAAQQAS
jgi:hypothetical protein